MSVTISDLTLFAHASFGVLGCFAATWVFFEARQASAANVVRLRTAALLTAVCMAAAWVFGGYWYVRFYPADKALILKGPWPFAHNVFMETKEHLFFATLILALLLPIAVVDRVHLRASSRGLVMAIAVLVLFTGLAVESAGAVINHGVRLALLKSAGNEANK